MRLRPARAGAIIARLSHSNSVADDFDSALQNLSPRLWDVRYSVLIAVVPSCREATTGFKTIRRRSKMRGINSDNLRSLGFRTFIASV